MTPARAKAVVAWALVDPSGRIWAMSVRSTRDETPLWPHKAAGWRVARVEIREIEEGQDDDHNRSDSHEH